MQMHAPLSTRCLQRGWLKALALGAGLLFSGMTQAAEFDGSQLSVVWGVPFAGILLSIALMPLLLLHFWHNHFG